MVSETLDIVNVTGFTFESNMLLWITVLHVSENCLLIMLSYIFPAGLT